VRVAAHDVVPRGVEVARLDQPQGKVRVARHAQLSVVPSRR
jgi:hypothetical protein